MCMDQKPGLFSAPTPQAQAPAPTNSGGGFFGSKAPPAPPAGQKTQEQTYQLSDLARRLRMVEESVSNTRKKVEINEENTLDDLKKKATELKSVFVELDAMKKEIRQFKDEMLKMVKEFQTLAKREDVAVLEKYIKLWEPIRYATYDQVERMIDEKIAHLHNSEQPSFDAPRQLNIDASPQKRTEIEQSHLAKSVQNHDFHNNTMTRNQEHDSEEDETQPLFSHESHIPLSVAAKKNKDIFDRIDEGEEANAASPTQQSFVPPARNSSSEPTNQNQSTSTKVPSPQSSHNPWEHMRPKEQPFTGHVAQKPTQTSSQSTTSQDTFVSPTSSKSLDEQLKPAMNQYAQNPAKYEVTAEQKKQIAELIEEFDDVRELLLSDPQSFEKRVYNDPHLAKLFKGVNITELAARLKPHYQ
jgi:hypothetical protein